MLEIVYETALQKRLSYDLYRSSVVPNKYNQILIPNQPTSNIQ